MNYQAKATTLSATSGDGLFDALGLLVDDRGTLDDPATRSLQEQVAFIIQVQVLRTINTQSDGSWIGAGSNYEVVFQLALAAVVYEVNAGANWKGFAVGKSSDRVEPVM